MVNNLEYNSNRSKLIIPEYGRHIQKMVEHLMTIKDDEKRTEMAWGVISVMGNLSPHLRDVPDFQHKLWDQLYMMSDYKLQVNSPFPMPDLEKVRAKPAPLKYPENSPKYRFYGNNIKRMIDEVKTWEEGEKKEAIILAIANHMKKSYLNWNKDTVEDKIIFDHLRELSKGKIDLKTQDEDLSDAADLVPGHHSAQGSPKHYGKPQRNKKKYRKGRSN